MGNLIHTRPIEFKRNRKQTVHLLDQTDKVTFTKRDASQEEREYKSMKLLNNCEHLSIYKGGQNVGLSEMSNVSDIIFLIKVLRILRIYIF